MLAQPGKLQHSGRMLYVYARGKGGIFIRTSLFSNECFMFTQDEKEASLGSVWIVGHLHLILHIKININAFNLHIKISLITFGLCAF